MKNSALNPQPSALIIKPQAGPQELFLRSSADIAIYGGAAGGGKTFALLLEPLRYVNVKGFNATIFRRNATQISIDGGLLDESMSIYGLLKGASYKASPRPHWTFGDSKISFMHIDGDRDLHKWQGSQICCEVNTPILMADGSFKPLGRIKVGDKVRTLEGVRSITFADTPIIKDCVKLTLPNGDFQIQSTDHKVLTSKGWLSFDDQTIFNVVIYHNYDSDSILKYQHSYTKQALTANVDFDYQPAICSPFDKCFVRNITVNKANHYITKAGIVNRNCYIGFDELTHFSANTFFYMLSRNRSTCGVKPYVRATCNPDADSWVAEFIDFWIDQESGYPLKDRSGVIRYFVRIDGEIKWADSPIELAERYNVNQSIAKSVTFIASSIFDNKVLLEKDQGYLANLNGLPIVERERLLKGNWKIKPSAGLYFKRSQTKIVNELPAEIVNIVRAWDLAATEITTSNKNPDRTCGVLMARLSDNSFIILDVKRVAFSASNVRSLIKQVSQNDRDDYNCRQIRIPQDPGQAGKDQAQSYIRELAGFNVKTKVITGDKVIRAEPLAAQWQIGNVLLLKGSWNETFLTELEGFPELLHDDQVDAAADAFSALAVVKKSVSKFDLGLH